MFNNFLLDMPGNISRNRGKYRKHEHNDFYWQTSRERVAFILIAVGYEKVKIDKKCATFSTTYQPRCNNIVLMSLFVKFEQISYIILLLPFLILSKSVLVRRKHLLYIQIALKFGLNDLRSCYWYKYNLLNILINIY